MQTVSGGDTAVVDSSMCQINRQLIAVPPIQFCIPSLPILHRRSLRQTQIRQPGRQPGALHRHVARLLLDLLLEP